MLARMDPATYAEHWETESKHLGSAGLYERLSEIAPPGRTLEIGCGIGLGTLALSATRSVLALDSNARLIQMARSRLLTSEGRAELVETDFLAPSEEAAKAIERFQPEVIVGWFLGSNADDQEKHVPLDVPPTERAKKYRERIEDAMLVEPLCPASVEWIHLATRGGVVAGVSEDFARSEEKDNYDEYVFLPKGFEVVDVQFLDWKNNDSTFSYIQAKNSRLMPGATVPKITSLLARRKRT